MCVLGVTLPYGRGAHQTPSSPRRRCGGGLARMAQFHCPYYRPPSRRGPAHRGEVVAGGACAARELLGGTQPFPFSWTHLFLLLFLGSGADNGSQAPPRERAQYWVMSSIWMIFPLGCPSPPNLCTGGLAPVPGKTSHPTFGGRVAMATLLRGHDRRAVSYRKPIKYRCCPFIWIFFHVDVLPRGLGWCRSNRFDSGEPWLGQL